jgi:hypothetical protein
MKLGLVGLIVPCDRSHRTVLLALSPLVRLLFLFFSYIFPPITVNEDTVSIQLVTDLVFFGIAFILPFPAFSNWPFLHGEMKPHTLKYIAYN